MPDPIRPPGAHLAHADDLKAELIAAWDRGAPTYDSTLRHGIIHADEWRAWRRLLAALLGDPAHSDVPPRRVLDVGTGTGAIALLAAELGHDVTGVDLSEAMLGEARRKSAAAGLPVEWRVADAEAIPADLVGFDVVVARHVLWTLPHPVRALEAWRDATRASGLVVVIDGVSRRAPWPLGTAQSLAARLVERANRGRSTADHAYPADAHAQLPLADQRDVRGIVAAMEAARLERIRVRPTPELDRVERGHQRLVERLADPWRRYLATGRAPIITSR